MSRASAIAKLNLGQITLAYGIAGLLLLVQIANYIISMLVPASIENTTLSIGNVALLVPLFAAILIPARNLPRMINLGGKRDDLFAGSVLAYVILCALAALALLLAYYTIDRFMLRYVKAIDNVMAWIGFLDNGPILAFIQMFSLILLLASLIHLFVLAQRSWYGWVAAFIIGLCIFIAPIRSVILSFINASFISQSALLQIASCLAATIMIFALSRTLLKQAL
ncbi:MAG: hypothetical protein FWD41_02080 [Actinomycetia bacterium]|nr:hypothetical protein [Actinomycetes bacterium]